MNKPIILIALCLVFLVGCGQKGRLYIPGTEDDPNFAGESSGNRGERGDRGDMDIDAMKEKRKQKQEEYENLQNNDESGLEEENLESDSDS